MNIRILFVASLALFFSAIPQTARAQKNGKAEIVILDEDKRLTLKFTNRDPDKQQCGFLVTNTLMENEEESLALAVSHLHLSQFRAPGMPERGWLYITASRIVFRVQTGDPSHAFDIPRKDLDERPGTIEYFKVSSDFMFEHFAPGVKIHLREKLQPSDSAEQKFIFSTLGRGDKCSLKNYRPYENFIKRAVNDFSGAMAEFKQLAASLQQSGKIQRAARPIAPVLKSRRNSI